MKICPTCQLKYGDADARCFVDGATLQAFADPRIGTLVAGRYLLEAPLGEGGMAVVYRARHVLVDRSVAVKVMNANLTRDAALCERFRREAKNAAAIAHPNIIEILDHGQTEDGTPYLVMELLEGRPLDRFVAEGPMAPSDVAAIGAQIARGLARAHDFQVLHRDLKPENVFIATRPGGARVAKILDFGIARSMHDARLTSAGQIFGTPQYMAPERVSSIDAGPSADLYALGVMLFEMATGRLPFEVDDLPGLLMAHLTTAPPRAASLVPSLPPALDALIARLLEKSPDARPVDAHAVVRELEALAPSGSVSPETASDAPAAEPSRRAAVTLPPTTLERWGARLAVLDQMVRRAAPPEAAAALASLHTSLSQLHDLRRAAISNQRKHEAMAGAAHASRRQLGHAMNVLGGDLSQAREAARAAVLEVRPHLDAEPAHAEAFARAQAALGALGGFGAVSAPSPALVEAFGRAHAALEAWRLAHHTAERARAWVAAKQQEVHDLAFQTEALRAQLERVEAGHEQERAEVEQALLEAGRQTERLEAGLVGLAQAVLAPLAGRADLEDLRRQLAQLDGA